MEDQWIIDEAENMLVELEHNTYKWKIIRDKSGGFRRKIESINPVWYSRIFQEHWNGKGKKDCRTLVRKVRLVRALKFIIKGELKNCYHTKIVMDEIKGRIEDGYECEGTYVPPRREWGVWYEHQ